MSYDQEEEQVCRLSHPAHPHTLSRRAGTDPPTGCFVASTKRTFGGKTPTFYYYCTTCDVEFHDGCHKSPRKMTHPYHPQHPLIFCVLDRYTGIMYDCNRHDYNGIIFHRNIHAYDEEFIAECGIPDHHGNIFDNCTWCGGDLELDFLFYRCSICNFCLCPPCSETFPLPTITSPKSHHHSLIFLPRPLLLPCDACGVVKKSKPSYACFQCNYVVHRDCIDLPRVIKLTRHPHRLSYTPFLAPKTSLCRLCFKTVDTKYGQYSCNHDDCSYVLHSECATHKNVWDGRELEWEPEEFSGTEDVAPFKIVGDGLIKYFCHEHHLKLKKYDGVGDADKQCQACIRHIDSLDFYNCMQCDFFLHEVCANLPRKLDHALHNHPLFLDPTPLEDYYSLDCLVCSRAFSGFRYKCSKSLCEDDNNKKFQVDVGCILVPDCFTHKSHEHPLFIPISTGNKKIYCKGCNRMTARTYLQCTLCEFALCYKCATIPDKLHYKYDGLPLSLCYGEVSNKTYWCELCEKELDPRQWFYICDKPYITVHRKCVFGSSAYMKSGYTFYYTSLCVKVICNSSNTRPICDQCNRRCSSFVYFKLPDETVVCSLLCFHFCKEFKLSEML